MGAGKEGVPEHWAGRRQRLPGCRGGRPNSGLRGSSSGTRRSQALVAAAACVGGRELNSGAQATRSGCMDLQALLLPTGSNGSNTSDGPDNLTSPGEPEERSPTSGLGGVGDGEVSPLSQTAWETLL